MSQLELRPLSSGELLDQAFRLYRGNFARLVLVGIVCYAPMALLYALAGTSAGLGAQSPSTMRTSVVLAVISVVFAAASWGALTTVAVGVVEDAPVGLGKALLEGIILLPRLLLLGILCYLLLFGGMIPAMVVGGVTAGSGIFNASGAAHVVVAIVVGIVLATIVVAGIVWWMSLTVLSLPAMVGERLGALASLKRANELAKGARVKSTALGFLGWLIALLPTLGFYIVLGLGSVITHPGAVTSVSASRVFLQQIVGITVGAVTFPYFIALTVLMYYERRVRREGYDVEVAAAALSTEVPA